MNYYIPFLLKNGDFSIYDLITSIVGAEGVAPTDASAFNGIEMPRSSPALFTGLHPLNPFKERLLVYDRLPLLSAEGKYTTSHENAAYIRVDSDFIKVPEKGSLRKVESVKIPGLTIYETVQAVFFSNPLKVSILFVSPKVYDKCQGCRAGVNVKNEKAFGYGVMSRTDEENAIVVADEYVDRIAVDGCFTPVSDGAYSPTWRMEALQGAALCYKLVKQSAGTSGGIVRHDSEEGDWQRIVQFTKWLGGLRYIEESWPGQKQLSHIVEQLKTLPSFVKKECPLEYFRMDDFGTYDPIHRKLIERFVEVAVSLKKKRWNWADNECRASLAESIMECCIVPVMKENFPSEDADKKIEAMASLTLMVKRRFREPNTYMEFDESNLNSAFVRALYRFLSSEGRLDRIQEYLGVESRLGLQVREMIAAMYGAFKGYAQISVKRLAPVRIGIVDKDEERQAMPPGGHSSGDCIAAAKDTVNLLERESSNRRSKNRRSKKPSKQSEKPSMKYIHQGTQNKRVSAEEYEVFLSNGWQPGRARKDDPKIGGMAETQGELGLTTD